MELIRTYFPQLDKKKEQQLSALDDLYVEWNTKINVISRKDIAHLYEHHVLHSLAVAKYNPFEDGTRVLDVGTGGGFPGIPLAIMFPKVHFTLLDATAKKINVVNEISKSLQLKNVESVHARMEAYQGSYDIVIGRAVSTLTQMVEWTEHLVPAGRWIILKGGDQREIRKELPPLYAIKFIPIRTWFDLEYFREKYIVDIQKA